jgi:hypothetical protein
MAVPGPDLGTCNNACDWSAAAWINRCNDVEDFHLGNFRIKMATRRPIQCIYTVDNVELREWPNADVIRLRKSKPTKNAPLT